MAELEKIPGYWRDIEKSRAEASACSKEAGHENLKLKFLNRQLGQPFQPAGIYAVDQWRRIGIQAEHMELETKLYFDALGKGDFDVAVNNISDFADDPSAQFNTLLSKQDVGRSPTRATATTKLDELFVAAGRGSRSGQAPGAGQRVRAPRPDAGLLVPAALVPAHRRQPQEGQGLGSAAEPLHRPDAGRRVARSVMRELSVGQHLRSRRRLRPKPQINERNRDQVRRDVTRDWSSPLPAAALLCRRAALGPDAQEGRHPELRRRRRAADHRLPCGHRRSRSPIRAARTIRRC